MFLNPVLLLYTDYELPVERLKKEVKGTCIRFPALPSNLLGKG